MQILLLLLLFFFFFILSLSLSLLLSLLLCKHAYVREAPAPDCGEIDPSQTFVRVICRPVCMLVICAWSDIGRHYLSDATLSNTASFVLCVFRRVKDHCNLLYYSSLLKNTCIRQVVLDKCFPLERSLDSGWCSSVSRVSPRHHTQLRNAQVRA